MTDFQDTPMVDFEVGEDGGGESAALEHIANGTGEGKDLDALHAQQSADIDGMWITPEIYTKDFAVGGEAYKEVAIWLSGKVVDNFKIAESEFGGVVITDIHPLYGLKGRRVTAAKMKEANYNVEPGDLEFNLITRDFR